jgi:hypothetical protein
MKNLQKKKHQIKEGAEQVSEAVIKFGGNLQRFFNKTLFLIVTLLFVNIINTTPGQATDNFNGMIYRPSIEELYVIDLKTKMKNLIVSEVRNYINKNAPNSNLTPEYLVDKCLEYDTDVIFVLAQGLLESHFGTRGRAIKTNSVWNVGAFDDGQNLYWYKTQDESLEPYLKLVNEKYLITVTSRGDTINRDIHHLVQDRGYVNYRGARFATAKNYENGLRKFMVDIDMKTPIGFYQQILIMSDDQIIAFFNPPVLEEDLYALN